MLSLFREFLADLRHQKMRSTLTVLGITWGTVAVVTLLAFGSGLAVQMATNARGIGDNVVILSPGRTTRSFEGFPRGREISLNEQDVAALRTQVDGIARISPEYGRYGPVRVGTTRSNPYLAGVYPEYSEMRNVFPVAGGRFFDELDMDGRRRVAFLGDELKALLFGDADAIGQRVYIGATPFTVIGVMRHKTQNSSYQARDADRIFIPSTTYISIFGVRNASRILYQPSDPTRAADVRARVADVLGRRHHFDPLDEDAVNVWDTSENLKFFHYLFLGFNTFLGVVGSFTLVVGGIGVANIMYIVVRERTHEIGVKRALGARRRDVLAQILFETALIVAIGAALGLALSVILVRAAGLLPIQEQVGTPTLSPLVITVTLALLAAVAFLAGIFPARRAAALDPVECLRYGR